MCDKFIALSLGLLMLLTSGRIPQNQKTGVTEIQYGEVQVPCIGKEIAAN
jgi:hypothetical protein